MAKTAAKTKSSPRKSSAARSSRSKTSARSKSGGARKGRGMQPKGMTTANRVKKPRKRPAQKTSTRSSGQKSAVRTSARGGTKGKSTASRSKQSGQVTTDHDQIRKWVEARKGSPATVDGTERKGEDVGLLRIDFPGFAGAPLVKIDWEEFFDKFEESNLAFLYDPDKGSKFNKFIAREKAPRRRKK